MVRGRLDPPDCIPIRFRDSRSAKYPVASRRTSLGRERIAVKAKSTRLVADVNATVSVHDTNVVWSSLMAARDGRAISAQASEPAILDRPVRVRFGSLTITPPRNGADTIARDTTITNPYGALRPGQRRHVSGSAATA